MVLAEAMARNGRSSRRDSGAIPEVLGGYGTLFAPGDWRRAGGWAGERRALRARREPAGAPEPERLERYSAAAAPSGCGRSTQGCDERDGVNADVVVVTWNGDSELGLRCLEHLSPPDGAAPGDRRRQRSGGRHRRRWCASASQGCDVIEHGGELGFGRGVNAGLRPARARRSCS